MSRPHDWEQTTRRNEKRTQRRENEEKPKQDAIDRFERMMDIQVSTLEEIDSKAARLISFVGVLLGAIATVSRLLPAENLSFIDSSSYAGAIALLVGIFGLLLTLVYATITYLSSEFKYGLEANVAEVFANVETLPPEEYKNIVLRGYADTIKMNEPVVKANARRFRYALAALVGSLFSLVFSAVFYVIDLADTTELTALLFGSIVVGSLCIYIRDEGYLVPDDEIDY